MARIKKRRRSRVSWLIFTVLVSCLASALGHDETDKTKDAPSRELLEFLAHWNVANGPLIDPLLFDKIDPEAHNQTEDTRENDEIPEPDTSKP